MKKIKQLNEFLEKEGVLREFYDNMNFNDEWIDVEPERLMTTVFSFDWARTKQGGDSWSRINKKYLKFLEEKLKRWKPGMDENYWYVNTGEDNGVYSSQYYSVEYHKNRQNYGNVFQTKDQAKEAAKRVKKCLKKYQKTLL